MKPNPYNLSQWNWIADRVSDGYRVAELAKFLDMNQNNIYKNLVAAGRRLDPDDRVPLDELKREFNALANDGSPSVNNYYVSVIGTDANGDTVRFDCTREAERSLGIPYGEIGKAIERGGWCHGYKWVQMGKRQKWKVI